MRQRQLRIEFMKLEHLDDTIPIYILSPQIYRVSEGWTVIIGDRKYLSRDLIIKGCMETQITPSFASLDSMQQM